MTQCSPGVERVAAILNFMAEHPDRAVSVSDLTRALKISRSTCYDLVSSLAYVGYLHRTSENTFVIGPSLALIGKIAAEHASPVLVAQPEMRALADEFEVICSAFFREGDYLVVRDRAVSGANLAWSSPKGARLRLSATFAGIFYAWSPPAEAEAWLASSAPTATPEEKALMSRAMAFTRTHGFIVSVRIPRASDRPDQHDAVSEGFDASTVSVLAELEPERQYAPLSITAPVFDAAQDVAFLLALVGFPQGMTGREIAQIGARLRSACDHIASFTGGSRPG